MTKKFIPIIYLLAMFCGNLFASENKISFDGEEYLAVHNETLENAKLTEYLRSSESLDNWTKMISIQEHSGASRIADVMNPYAEARQSLYMRNVEIYWKSKERGNEDAIFEFLLKSPDGSFVEFTLVRAVSRKDESVVLYILTRKISAHNDSVLSAQLKDSLDKRYEWFGELGQMKLGVSEE